MKWLTDGLKAQPVSAPRSRASAPAVEQLEGRLVPSAATIAVASGIVNSPENFGDFVASEYTSLLRRQPDQAGFNFWVNQMVHGVTPEVVEAAFASSGEYVFNNGNSPDPWLNALYRDLLNRAPDTAGKNSWLNAMNNGATAAQVAIGFAFSPEREGIIISQDYTSFLGRTARTDEVVAWNNTIQQHGGNRGTVEVGILASDEFFANANKDPSTFITHTYQDALKRTPSQPEINFWLSVYNSH